MTHALRLLTLVVVLAAGTAAAERLMLVTLDCAPLESPALHPDARDRQAVVDQWLAALKRHKVPAIVFAAGNRLEGTAGLFGRWVRAGHDFGTLGFSGKNIGAMALPEWKRDLEAGKRALIAAVAAEGGTTKVRWFRFPQLSEGSSLDLQLAAKSAVATAGMRVIDATIDTVDPSMNKEWLDAKRKKNGKLVAAELAADWLAAMRAVTKRSETVGDKVAGADVPQILRLRIDAIGAANADALFGWLARRGYRFVKADDILGHPVFSKPHGYTGRRGVSLFWRLRISEDLKLAEKSVSESLFKAAESWSRGNLDGFMEAFHDNMRFVSGRTIIEGRASLHAAYKKRYPSASAMGRLVIEIVRFDIHTSDRDTLFGLVEPIPPRYAIATVKWTLTPKTTQGRTGFASLALMRGKDGWRILEDHSTTGAFLGKPKTPPASRPR